MPSNGDFQAGLGLEFDLPIAGGALDLADIERGLSEKVPYNS